MTRGGARKGAGRKPAAIEDNVRAAIKTAIGDDPNIMNNIWKKVFSEAKKGSTRHTEILFNYYYGKPKETVAFEGGLQINLTRKIVTK
jgi:hypothetical protein